MMTLTPCKLCKLVALALALPRALSLQPTRRQLLELAPAAALLAPRPALADMAPGFAIVDSVNIASNPAASKSRDAMNGNVLFGQDFYFKYGRSAPFLQDASSPLPDNGAMPFTRVQQRYEQYSKYATRCQAGIDAFAAVEGQIKAGDWAKVDATSPAFALRTPPPNGHGLRTRRRRTHALVHRSLFDAVVGLAFLRVAFYAVFVGATPGGAALGRRALLRCHAVLAVLVSAALARVAYRRLAGDLDPRRTYATTLLLCGGLASLELWRRSWDYLRSRAPRERDAFYDVLGDDAPGLLARFERRGASIRAFWAGVVEELDAELARARALVLDSLPRGLSSRDCVADADARDEPFALLLRLFAHEDVLAALRGAFRADREAATFYVLQLATFVLFGAFWDGPALRRGGTRAIQVRFNMSALRELLLGLCADDVVFAHGNEFYLRSFADSSAKSPGLRLTAGVAGVAALRAYDDAPAFVDALTAISDGLCDLPREARAAPLAAALEELDATAVPSLRGAYVPLGRAAGRHRVLRARVLGAGRGRRRLVPVIVKARDDLRQEQFAAQLLRMASRILEDARVPVVLRTYDVVATGPDAGLIEALPDAMSLDALRRSDGGSANLLDFFYRRFGAGPELARARANFVESLAPACVLSYLLQIKDRHNGNILLDAAGRLAHVDFGYLLASSPGGNLGFEAAPFKLTAEFLDVVGPDYRRFRDLCVRVFLALRAERHKLLLLAEMTVSGCDHLPCFDGRPRETIDALRRRFKPKLSDRQVRAFVHGLIDKSTNNWRTHADDRYQRVCVGIF
ncbi:phosphatidylinositol kinase [Aureococcus anophagefferens]|nr:phosphatidylinositol kinase [Aureococcus anophagefferens]